jgi:hypothetical protein
MTRREAEDLVSRSGGKLCVRYFRHSNGRIVTADYPAKPSPLTASILAGSFSALVSISSTASAQSSNPELKKPQAVISVSKDAAEASAQAGGLSGWITDPNNLFIKEAMITLVSEVTGKKLNTMSDDNGEFTFKSLSNGKYTLSVNSPGFNEFAIQHLDIHQGEEVKAEITMQVGPVICEVIEVRGSALSVVMGTVGVVQRPSLWERFMNVVTYPYKQGTKIFSK